MNFFTMKHIGLIVIIGFIGLIFFIYLKITNTTVAFFKEAFAGNDGMSVLLENPSVDPKSRAAYDAAMAYVKKSERERVYLDELQFMEAEEMMNGFVHNIHVLHDKIKDSTIDNEGLSIFREHELDMIQQHSKFKVVFKGIFDSYKSKCPKNVDNHTLEQFIIYKKAHLEEFQNNQIKSNELESFLHQIIPYCYDKLMADFLNKLIDSEAAALEALVE
jgi:hypothetical protein